MHRQYILVDFENVQPKMLEGLDADHFRIVVFVGASQRKVPIETAAMLQVLGSRAQYVQISGTGPNALDFHIAYWLGTLISSDPTAFYYVVSRDTGFDPLLRHVNGQKVFACRVMDFAEIPLIKALRAKSPSERASVVATHLAQRGQLRPRSMKTLANSIRSLFQSTLSDADMSAIVKTLEARGILKVTDDRVSYSVAASGA